MKNFAFYISVWLSFSMPAQNAADEILKMNKAFYQRENTAVEVVTKIYSGASKEPIQESRLTVFKMNTQYHFINGPSESVMNKKYRLFIDHKKKFIMVDKANPMPVEEQKRQTSYNRDNFNVFLDSLLTHYKDVKVKTINSELRELSFTFKKGQFKDIRIIYRSGDYLVKEYFITFSKPEDNTPDEQTPSVCHIKNNYLEKKLSDDDFKEADYIAIGKKDIVPNTKYSGYMIINNIKKG